MKNHVFVFSLNNCITIANISVDVLPLPDSYLGLLNTSNEAIQHFHDTVASFYILMVMKIALNMLYCLE